MLRDPAADVSLQLTAPVGLVRGNPAVADGNRVVVHGKPSFFLGRGTLSLRVDEIRAVGIGELLARIERLRQAAGRRGPVRPGAQAPAAVPARAASASSRAGARPPSTTS